MSKILFTIAFYHDGPSRRPQFIISTNNLYAIQMRGTDYKNVKFGNSNLGNGFRHRFEYSVSGSKAVTRLSLVMNTTAVLPHMTWASPHPSGPPTGKGPRGPPGNDSRDDRRVSRPNPSSRSRYSDRHSDRHSDRDRDERRRRRRHHHAIDDGNVQADDGDGGGDFGGDDGGGY